MKKKKTPIKAKIKEKPLNENTDLRTLNTAQLCTSDPVARTLLVFTGQSLWRTYLMVIVVYGIGIFGMGFIISKYYEANGMTFLSLLDRRDSTFGIFAYMVASPTAWLYYIREPLATLKIFQGLLSNGVIGDNRQQSINASEFLHKELTTSYEKRIYLILILFITVAVVAYWVRQALGIQNTFGFGYTVYWWSINRYYLWIIWIPLTFVNLYMVLWILLRRVITITIINKLFRVFEVQPKLFHPDKANGMFPIGQYITGSSFLMMIAGIWVFLVITYPMFFGQGNNLRGDTIIFLLIYLVGVPSILIIPSWETHLLMRKFKSNALENTANQIRNTLETIESFGTISNSSTSDPELLKKIEVAEALQKKYSLFEREYRTWPFNMSALRQFGLATLSPLFSTFLSIYVDFLLNRLTPKP